MIPLSVVFAVIKDAITVQSTSGLNCRLLAISAQDLKDHSTCGQATAAPQLAIITSCCLIRFSESRDIPYRQGIKPDTGRAFLPRAGMGTAGLFAAVGQSL